MSLSTPDFQAQWVWVTLVSSSKWYCLTLSRGNFSAPSSVKFFSSQFLFSHNQFWWLVWLWAEEFLLLTWPSLLEKTRDVYPVSNYSTAGVICRSIFCVLSGSLPLSLFYSNFRVTFYVSLCMHKAKEKQIYWWENKCPKIWVISVGYHKLNTHSSGVLTFTNRVPCTSYCIIIVFQIPKQEEG